MTVVGGKGGVGKTSVAAALAVELAATGARTLVISTDPAHSLGDVLDTDLGDRPREVAPNLHAVEPDADATVRRRIDQVHDDAAEVLPREILPAVRRHLQTAASGPSVRESALAERLVSVLGELGTTWDRIVVDSAPTGHLLPLLRAPSVMADWVADLAARRARSRPPDHLAVAAGRVEPPDPLTTRLHERRERMAAAAEVLRTDAVVQLVCTPRKVVVRETERAAEGLRAAGLTLAPTILNDLGGAPDAEAVTRLRSRLGPLVSLPAVQPEPVGSDALRAWWAQAVSGT